jgi:hypothetical protein
MRVFQRATRWRMIGNSGDMRFCIVIRRIEWTRGLSPLLMFVVLLISITTVSAQEAYFVQATVDNPTPFVGEQVVYTMQFYAESMPAHDYFEPRFEGWWRGESITTTVAEVIDGRQYTVVTYETILYPLQSGEMTIEAARIVVPETVFSEQLEFISEPIMLQVQPLPQQGVTSAVGRYTAEIEIEKSTLTLGEPITLRYRVSGTGNVAQVPLPELALPEGWRSYPNPATTSLTTRGTGERIFEWRLMPEMAGTHEFPSNEFTYFDPQLGEYQTVTTPAFSVDVLPSEDGQRELPQFRRGANAPAALALKPTLTTSPSQTVPLWVWLLPPLAAVMVWSSVEFRERRKIYNAEMRQQNALKMARTRLSAARKLSAKEAYGRIQETIEMYFADKVNHPEKHLSPFDLNTPDAVRQSYLRAEEGRYAPPGVIDVNEVVVQTMDALTLLDKNWS